MDFFMNTHAIFIIIMSKYGFDIEISFFTHSFETTLTPDPIDSKKSKLEKVCNKKQ